MQYRIGDFAEQMGVSIDFIKYYEEKGLITSRQDANNRYHYYALNQSVKLLHILLFRSMGYSAKDIYELLHGMDADQAYETFGKQADILELSRKKLDRSIAELRYYQSALERGKRGEWYITQIPAMYFLPHTNGAEYIRSPETASRVKQWNNHFPFVFYVDRWLWDEKDKRYTYEQHGRAIEASMAAELEIDVSGPVYYVPAVRCLEYYLDYGFDDYEKLTLDKYEEVFRIIKKQNFNICGDMFVRYITLTEHEGKQNALNVLYIPVQ